MGDVEARTAECRLLWCYSKSSRLFVECNEVCDVAKFATFFRQSVYIIFFSFVQHTEAYCSKNFDLGAIYFIANISTVSVQQ